MINHITPKTKVAELLDTYPQLEQVLIDLVPEFSKLRNPILRKTIAKVASLEQASSIGKISIDVLINTLRKAVGQDVVELEETSQDYYQHKPAWFDNSKVKLVFDAVPIINAGEHPMPEVLKKLETLTNGDIFELKTPFLPSPLIDIIKSRGYDSWSVQKSEDLVISYFTKDGR